MKKPIQILFLLLLVFSCSKKESAESDNSSTGLNGQAVELMKNGKYDDALELLDKAIQIDETYRAAYMNKVAIYKHRKQYDKALSTILKITDLFPEHGKDWPEWWLQTGMLYDLSGDRKKADETYIKVISMFTELINNPEKESGRKYNRANLAMTKMLLEDSSGKDELKALLQETPEDDPIYATISELLKKNREDILKEVN